MNIKPIAYHWTKSNNRESIMEYGLIAPSGFYGRELYLDVNPTDLFENQAVGGNTLLGVHLRGIERQLVSVPDKKWLKSNGNIPPENIFYIGEGFENKEQLKETIYQMKISLNLNSRSKWPIRKELIK